MGSKIQGGWVAKKRVAAKAASVKGLWDDVLSILLHLGLGSGVDLTDGQNWA